MFKILASALVFSFLSSMPAAAEEAGQPAAWNGPYIGAFVGAGISQNDINFGGPVPDFDVTKAIYGGFAGYNKTHGHWVYGIEGEIGGFGHGIDIKSDKGDTDLDIRGLALIRGRLEMRIANHMLAYASAGLALTEIKIFEDSSGRLAGREVLAGFTVGAGLETQVHQDWNLRLDYSFAHFGKETITGKQTFVDQTAEIDVHMLRVGLSRQFSIGY